MSTHGQNDMLIGYLIGLVVALVLTIVTFTALQDHWKADAVKHGKAEWAANANGSPEWRWKP